MKIQGVIVAMLLQASGAIAGEWIVQPQPDGTVRMRHEGVAEGGSADTLIMRQPANKALTVQITPAGRGRCEKGDLVIGSLRFPVQTLQEGKPILCGEIASWAPASGDKLTGLRSVKRSFKIDRLPIGGAQLPRIPFGNITFNIEGDKGATVFPVWLDLSALQAEVATLQATFNRSDINFGKVSELSNSNISVKLFITKTPQAGKEALPYILRFESTQQRNNNYYLTSSDGRNTIPYQISVSGRDFYPDMTYHSVVPAGPATSDEVGIAFLLKGEYLQGMEPGKMLSDTLTAVITPDS